jgi:hypothetical protein
MRQEKSARYILNFSSTSLYVTTLVPSTSSTSSTSTPDHYAKSSLFKCSLIDAHFHPLSDNFVVILTHTSLITLRLHENRSKKEEEEENGIQLQVIDTLSIPPLSCTLSAFCFGSFLSNIWSAFNVYFLCVDGNIYCLECWLPKSIPVPVELLDKIRVEATTRSSDNHIDDMLLWLSSNFSICENDLSYATFSFTKYKEISSIGSSLRQVHDEYLPIISGPYQIQGPEYRNAYNKDFCNIALVIQESVQTFILTTRSNKVLFLVNLSSIVLLPICDKQHNKSSSISSLWVPRILPSRNEWVVVYALNLEDESQKSQTNIMTGSFVSTIKGEESPYFLQHPKVSSIVLLVTSLDIFSLDLFYLKTMNTFFKTKEIMSRTNTLASNGFKVNVTRPFYNDTIKSNQVLIVSSTVLSAILVELSNKGRGRVIEIKNGFSNQDLLESLVQDKDCDENDDILDFKSGKTIEKKFQVRSFFKRRQEFSEAKILSATNDEVKQAKSEEDSIIQAAKSIHYPETPTIESVTIMSEEMKSLSTRLLASKEKTKLIEDRLIKSLHTQLGQLKDVEAALYAWKLRRMESRG